LILTKLKRRPGEERRREKGVDASVNRATTNLTDAQACAHCGAPAEQGPYLEAICVGCAMRLGAEEARERNAHPSA
jgi:hypothetical protein